jgi:hypothetical protein
MNGLRKVHTSETKSVTCVLGCGALKPSSPWRNGLGVSVKRSGFLLALIRRPL